jgi:GntR family transcriptional regulator
MIIRIEASSGVPILRQISDQVRDQCVSGALKPGDRLPSVRELAGKLAVNQNTILHVYERLTMEGLLERRHGEGTFVAQELPYRKMEALQQEQLADHVRQLAYKARTLQVPPQKVHTLLEEAFTELKNQSEHSSKKSKKTPKKENPQ